MKIKSEISLTLAEIITRTIFPYAHITSDNLSHYLLDAQQFNQKAFLTLVEGQRKLISTGSIVAAVKLAKALIK